METGKCSFSVVRVRTEIVVSFARDAVERDEEKADADLARGMMDLSLSGERNEGSVRAGCVSKVVQDLHKALIECINHFFVGWSVDDSDWSFLYPTNLGPRCLPVNSGFFVVHYARASDGQALYYDVKDPTDSNLSEACAEIVYWLFVMSGNQGYFPEDLFQDLGIYI